MDDYAVDNRPKPTDPAERTDWEEAGVRHRMLDGPWRVDADRRLKEFFAPEVRQFLPRAVTAFCPLRSYVQETSTLYNGSVTALMGGKRLEDQRLALDILWAQQQQTLEFVRGLNDCYVRRDWDADNGCVTYTTVPPSCAIGSSDPRNPSQPNRVRYLVERDDIALPNRAGRVTRWVWQDYDFRQPDAPVFRVVVAGDEHDGGGTDVTAQVLRQDGREDARPGNWQWWDRSNKPIWTWTAYHNRVGPRLRSPFLGHEVVEGTLIAACLWTYWLGGFRDAAWNLRWMLDCEVPAMTGPNGAPQPYLAANPMAVMQARSIGNKQGQMGAFPTPFDVEGAGRSIGQFMASLGLFMGLSSADTSVTGSGLSRVSGFAIEVSRDGKRKIEERMVLPTSLSDRHNLAGAARLANAYLDGPPLSERPADYGLVYASTPKGLDELRAEVEAAERQVEAGLLDPRDAIRRMRPDLTIEGAEEYAVKAAEFRARLAGIVERAKAVRPDGVDAATPAPEVTPRPEVDAGAPLAATAPNGAQVTSALEIVQQVAAGQLPRESAVSMLVEFFQLTDDAANRVLGKVGKGFEPAPDPNVAPAAPPV